MVLDIWGLVRLFHTEPLKAPVWAAFSSAFSIRKLVFEGLCVLPTVPMNKWQSQYLSVVWAGL